jgi:hypothetical protein
MRPLKCLSTAVFLGLAVLGGVQPLLGQQTGTLVLEMKPYSSDAKLPKAVQKQLEHAGLQWGIADRTLLFPLVNQKFVKVDTLNLTRFGEQRALPMAPGDYTITCIGFDFNSTSANVDKSLSKNAFFDIDVLKFTILSDRTTTIEVTSDFKPQSAWFRLSKVTMYNPEVKVRVLQDGAQTGDAVVIDARTDKSVAWDDYKGPFKF